MNPCETFEIAIEMRLHGALDRVRQEELAAHLATCFSCRSFENLAKGTEKAMNQQAAVHLQTLDWDALWPKTKGFVERQARERLKAGAIMFVAMMPMVFLLGNASWDAVAMIAALSAAILAFVWVSARRKVRALAAYEGDTGELLFFYRSELENRLRSTNRILFTLPVWLVAVARSSFLHHDSAPRSPMHLAGILGMGAVILGGVVYVWFVRRPRIRRELDQLKADLKKS